MASPACGHTHNPFSLPVRPLCLLVSGRFLFPPEKLARGRRLLAAERSGGGGEAARRSSGVRGAAR